MLRRLLDGRVDMRGFDAILVGGAGMDPALRARAAAAGANVVQTYGLTESAGGVVYDGVPLQGVEVHVSPTDGEVRLRGASLMRGYRFDAPATAAAFDRDGWLRTWDAGRMSGGTLTVLGRMDGVIVTGGEKVWPEQVEATLLDAPGVAEVAVAGLPDGTWGQRVVAFVVPADGTEAPSLDRLRGLVARTLPRYAAPKELVLVERLPRTASGKIRRSALAADRSGHPSERAPRPR
jgi:O-succinylbenzoic acid--CoA ligase